MTTSFNQLANEVMLKRQNYGAPETMKLKTPVKTTDMTNKVITINEIVVSNKVKKDEDGNIIKTKDGTKDIYQPIVYVAFDDEFYFVTKSQLLIDQLTSISNQELVFYEKKEVSVKGVSGLKAKVSSEKVKYRDGKMYDQVILKDAE